MAGPTVAKTAHFALHRAPLAGPADAFPSGRAPAAAVRPLFPVAAPWLGVVLPKRWAKRAVTRNAIRRQIYETARPLTGQLPAAVHVVRLRAGFSREQFVSASSDALKRAVRAELLQLWSRAGLTAAVGNPSHAG
jgi:ribonuclease P protein component